jgi:hypothetical protein
MVTKEDLDNALSTHALWKKRLQEAIENGKSEFQVSVVQKDNACQFGQWLYNFSEQEKQSDDYIKVKDLHAEFHKTAADILQLAINGDKFEALKRIESGGGYSRITGKLIIALNSWKSKV